MIKKKTRSKYKIKIFLNIIIYKIKGDNWKDGAYYLKKDVQLTTKISTNLFTKLKEKIDPSILIYKSGYSCKVLDKKDYTIAIQGGSNDYYYRYVNKE